MAFFELLGNISVNIFSSFLYDNIRTKNSNNTTQKLTKSCLPIIENEIETNISGFAFPVISSRLQYALNTLNGEFTYQSSYSISKIAEDMQVHSIGEVENYFSGKAEPSINWLKQFAHRYRLNPNWLLHGEGQIFSHHLTLFRGNYQEAINQINTFEPDSIYFIKDDSEDAFCIIVITKLDGSFNIIHRSPCNWKISDLTGATGQTHTFDYYQIIQKFISNRNYCIKIYGSIINRQDLIDIESGRINIPTYKFGANSNWFEDLSDFKHEKYSVEYYSKWYGESFLNAQHVIYYQIEEKLY